MMTKHTETCLETSSPSWTKKAIPVTRGTASLSPRHCPKTPRCLRFVPLLPNPWMRPTEHAWRLGMPRPPLPRKSPAGLGRQQGLARCLPSPCHKVLLLPPLAAQPSRSPRPHGDGAPSSRRPGGLCAGSSLSAAAVRSWRSEPDCQHRDDPQRCRLTLRTPSSRGNGSYWRQQHWRGKQTLEAPMHAWVNGWMDGARGNQLPKVGPAAGPSPSPPCQLPGSLVRDSHQRKDW